MKKIQVNWKQLVASILIVTMFATSVSLEAFATENTDVQTNEESMAEKSDVQNEQTEYQIDKADIIQSELTTDSTTYHVGNGKKVTEFYSQDVRFEDEDGKLVDYDPTLIKIQETETKQGVSLQKYAYENKSGDKKQYFPEELSEETPILLEYEKYQIRLAPLEISGNDAGAEAAVAEEMTDTTQQTIDNSTDNIGEKVSVIVAEPIEVEKETITDIYEKEKTVPLKAVYQSSDEQMSFQYTSTDIGVKEEIVLEEVPETNVFTSIIEIPGLTIRENATDEGLTIYDGDDIVAGIMAPNMNDATGEAYSESATYDLAAIDEEAGKYQLILTVDEGYLKDEDRQYPVTIDPTISWSGNSKVSDVYVLSGSSYKALNFYDSGVTAFHAGKVSQGISRTYIAFASISALYGRYVESAKLVLTEAGSSDASQTVNAYRVTGSWSKSTLTWNNKPSYNTTVLSSIKTKGTTYTKYTLNLTTLFRGYAKKSYSNYGILLRNSTETGKHGRFFGSRHATSSYRPKLTVVHYDPPTVATSLTVTPQYVKEGSTVTAKWAGITSQGLSYVQYRLAGYDHTNNKETGDVVSYSTSTKLGTASSGSVTITASSGWAEGAYKFVVRGVDKSGIAGTGKGYYVYVDGTAPTMDEPVITPVTTEETKTDNLTPTISWSNATDKYFKQVECKIDDGSFVAIGTTASGTYTLPEGSIESNGEHTITVRAIDKAGHEKSYVLKYYVYSEDLGFDNYLPKENSLKIRNEYGKNILSWETTNPLSGSVYYRIYRGESEEFTADESSMIAENVKGSYWTDIQSVSDKTYYYKIEVVRVNADGTLDDSEMIPTALSKKGTALSTLQKRTGSKSYLGYYSFSTPIGNGTIEKSEGNLCYSQEDVVLSENQLTLDVTRTYNSQLSLSGMFGEGWSDSLHKELMKDAEGNIYFMEGDGTVYTFTYDEGSYICGETKEYELQSGETAVAIATMTIDDEAETIQQAGVAIDSSQMGTVSYAISNIANSEVTEVPNGSVTINSVPKEKTEEVMHTYTLKTDAGLLYRFNEGGQLVAVLEPNGTFLLYQYTVDGRLASIQTQNEKKITLEYDADGHVTSILLPDGTNLAYVYENQKIVESVHLSKDKAESVSNNYEYTENKLVAVTDRKGQKYQISYDGEKAKTVTYPNEDKYTLAFGDGTTYVTFPNGKSTCTVYDSQTGKVTKEIDVFGEVTAYEYGFSANPYLVTKTIRTIGYEVITDGKVEFKTAEKVTETSYNEEEQVTSEVSEDGTVTEYTYGETSEWAEDFPTEIISEKEGVIISSIETDYDDEGNIVIETDDTDVDNISITKTDYDDAGNMTDSIITEDGIVVSDAETEYDELGNIVTESTQSGEVVSSEKNTYDSMGRILKTTDTETGEVTAYTYDYLGRVIKIESTVSEKTLTSTSVYDANGTVISETDTNGVQTTYEYDAINRVVSRTVSKDISITYTISYSYGDIEVYDGRNEKTISNAYIEKESYPDGTTAYEKYYDANGKLVKEKANGLYVDYTFDESGNQVVSYSNGTNTETEDGRISLTLYDEEGRQIATIENPLISGNSYTIGEDTILTTQTYDVKGNVQTETDAEGIVTSYAYDDSSRITQVTQDVDGEKVVTKAAYTTDEENSTTTISVTDAEGHVSEEILDAAGLTKSTRDYGNDSESIGISYEYDSRGNQIKEIYENGAYKTYTYDDRNLLIATKTFTGEDVQTLQSDYTYDNQYRLTKMVDSKSIESEIVPYRYSYTGYDVFGRTAWTAEVNSESEPVDDVIENHKIKYTYDVEDKVTDISYALVETGGVESLKFVYNNNRWLESVQAVVKGEEAVKTVREYSYDTQGKVSEIKEYPDFTTDGDVSISKTYTYNELDQVVSMVYKKGSELLESYAYKYDKNGNIIEETEVNNTPAKEADKVHETRQYTYDTLGRLVKTVVTDHLDADTQQTTVYEYDKVGNRTKKTHGSEEITYTYNGLDQLLTAVTNRGGTEAGTSTYTYDGNGNQVKEVNTDTLTTTVNVYDEENRLSKVTRTSSATEETFEQENLYNGEGQRIQKKEGAKVTNYFYQDGVVSYTTDAGDNTKVIQNLLGLEGNIISAELKLETAEESGDSHQYYLYNKDIQGSTVSILDETGAGELSYTYDDFGETEIHGNSSLENEICYTGGIYDAGTGLYYLNARYYDPETGRFLTEDTYRGELEEPDTLHLYVYCKNNPVNYVDPSGHFALTLTMTVGAFYSTYHVLLALGATIIVGYTVYQVAKINRIKGKKYSIKFSKKRVRSPIGRRKSYNSKKKAQQAAKKAGGGKNPINHPKGCHGNKRPHYHPNVKNNYRSTPHGVSSHDHYYYPR